MRKRTMKTVRQQQHRGECNSKAGTHNKRAKLVQQREKTLICRIETEKQKQKHCRERIRE